MELIRPIASAPPCWWTGGGGLPLLQNVKRATNNVSVQPTTPLRDLFSLASSVPITSRTSVEAILQGTKIRLVEMRVKLMHKYRNSFNGGEGQAGFIGLTGATDLHRRHRVTLESTLGSDEDRQSVSAFISSRFEPRISWGIAVSRRFQQAVTYFARFNSEESSRHRFIFQHLRETDLYDFLCSEGNLWIRGIFYKVVHKVGKRNTFSPIFSKVLGDQPQAGLSWTHHLNDIGSPGKNSVQVKLFCSGSGAYLVSVKAQAGEVDAF